MYVLFDPIVCISESNLIDYRDYLFEKDKSNIIDSIFTYSIYRTKHKDFVMNHSSSFFSFNFIKSLTLIEILSYRNWNISDVDIMDKRFEIPWIY